ncbi:AAA family ATPase, partial [Flavobacterium filum]|uniref:AAA family ATPase n=1 Tax=Flavobacterium filum TaxID=370974 RepID=UPI0023F3CC5C
MELKFIWIQDYKNIKNIGFNFNHSIEEEFQFVNGEIIINSKSNNTPKKFFKDNISGVTAVVGKNGSGKTNLTEFLNFNLAHVTNGGLAVYFANYKGIVIIGKFIFYQESIKIENKETLEKLGYEMLDYKHAPLDKQGGRKWAIMSENAYVYYSPSFEFRYINMRDNLMNISTSYLAFNDANLSTRYYNIPDYPSYSNTKITDTLTAHYINEMIREADFILNHDSKKYIDVTPTELIVSVDSLEENRLLQTEYISSEETDEKKINKGTLWSELSDLENQVWNYWYSELQHFKIADSDEEQLYDYYLIPVNNQKDFFRRLFLINLFKILVTTGTEFNHGFLRNSIYKNENPSNVIEKKIKEIDEKLIQFIEKCSWEENKQRVRKSSYFDKNELGHFELIRNATLNTNNDKEKNTFVELLNLCNEITESRIHFHYKFTSNYSSGQKSLLNFYSRFYWVKNQISANENQVSHYNKKKQLIIFIDEGETALHPEWQRVFFNKATIFLSELFEDRKIQLILTTHSPFVLSDIPKDNVIFLNRDGNGNCMISTVEIKNNTFGANIHDLL